MNHTTPTYRIGDAVEIDGMTGVWLIVRDEAKQIAANPRLEGTIRVEKVFDGAGPAHLSGTVDITDCRPATIPEDDPENLCWGVRFTAGNGEALVRIHRAAYASHWEVAQSAGHLQKAVGLPVDAHIVDWNYGDWVRHTDATPSVPCTLYQEVNHNHTYWNDGVTPVVQACRQLPTCRTSLAMAEVRAALTAGQPRFVELDLDAMRAAKTTEDGEPTEYGMAHTQDGERVERPISGLAYAAHAVRLTRDLQKMLGDPVDAVLIARRPATDTTPAGPWKAVKIAISAMGEPGTLRTP
ncbi:hypothetical protein [Streptosporangium roseum]|uniref:hypothetical protein n=1 Tax=Streptosporangium roseum TaxID=2001 RepID=UPI0033288543